MLYNSGTWPTRDDVMRLELSEKSMVRWVHTASIRLEAAL